jgi:glucose/mannose-6-phosphate isomerase
MVEQEAIDLDDSIVYRKFDKSGMLTHIHNFPRLCREAWTLAQTFQLPEEYTRVKTVLVLGMGGSAIGGDLVGSLAFNESAVPVLVCRDCNLPQYVDTDTLVIASSYSGMTEETLSAFEQAFDTGALKLAVTTGGKLKALCETMNVPVFTFDYKAQPRAALPFSFFILLGILNNLKLLKVKDSDLDEAFANLETLAGQIDETIPTEQNSAKALTQKLFNRLPIIYGTGITAEVAHRWKTQINENSKVTCFYEVFSELNHNAIVGYSFPEELLRQAMVVMLDSDLLHERIHIRYEVTQKLLERAGIYYQVIKMPESGALSQMMSLVLFGDYVSYYLAMLNRTDPTTIEAINYLKDTLARR